MVGDNEGGLIVSYDQSSTGLIYFDLNGGATSKDKGSGVDLNDDLTADQADLSLYGGDVDVSAHNPPGVAVGEIDGTGGKVFLGSRNLGLAPTSIFGSTCKASLQDGGKAGGTGGMLTKTGPNDLILAAASTYTGGTIG